jgi:thioredoxin reductase (NADPH)
LDSVDKVLKLVEDGKVKLITDAQIVEVGGNERLEYVIVEDPGGRTTMQTDYFIPLFGLTPKLGRSRNGGLILTSMLL